MMRFTLLPASRGARRTSILHPIALCAVMSLAASNAHAQLLPNEPGWLARSGNGITWKEFFGKDEYFSCAQTPKDIDHLRRPPDILPRGLNPVERELLRCYEVRVRNTIDRPIQCTAVVEQIRVARGAGERVEGASVINPGLMDDVLSFLGSATQPPTKFSTQCFAIPASPPAYTEPTPECRVELTMPPAQDFAPVSPRMFPEAGGVMFDFSVLPGSDRLSDVRIVGSSRFSSLDRAALGVAHESRVRGGCAGTRYRQSVEFAAVHPPHSDRTTTAIMDVTDGFARQNGEARWKLMQFRGQSAVCGLTGEDRQIELGKLAGKQPRVDADDCVAVSAKIHNLSPAPIFCRATFSLPRPDDSGRTDIRGERLILPNATDIVATVYAAGSSNPPMPITDCDIRDTPVPPPPSCDAKFLRFPNPDLYYTPDSQAREEQGDVVLDFRIDPVAQKLRDIRIAQSSQYPALDLAALKVGKEVLATTKCPDVRRQAKVKFRIKYDEPAPAATR